MGTLLFKQKTYYEVTYHDLEDFARPIYNLINYEFAAVEECGNSSNFTYDIDGKIDSYLETGVQSIRNGSVPLYSNRLLLNLLCKDGHIPPGNYLISVFW